jgi:putative ABC transport system substrate-binding protein
MRRREFMALIGGFAIAWSLACYAQQPKQPLKHVGVLAQVRCSLQPDNPVVRGLGELGWIEGQNFVFDCVSAVGHIDQIPALARELVSRRPDVLMAEPSSSSFVSALKQETTTIPIVMLGGWEPVRLGLITSLARPEGNVTGVAWFDLLSKQMELLKEIVPHLKRVAFITGVPGAAYFPPEVPKIVEENLRIAAGALGFTWQVFRAAVENDYDGIFARLAAEHFDAAYISTSPFNFNNFTRICELALRHRIPTVTESTGFVRPVWWGRVGNCGLLVAYAQDFPQSVARAMGYVDKILRGAKPGDLPVEQATKIDLVINLKTAKTLGLTVPPSLIARADEVIE